MNQRLTSEISDNVRWTLRTLRDNPGDTFEFPVHSATSEGWHVQWEVDPPGKESEPRSLGCIRGGNEADEANRQNRPWGGERVTGPQRK